MKSLWLNHLPWWIPWWLENPHASSWKEGEQSDLLVFCPNTSSGEWVVLLLLCSYSLGPGEIEKVVSLFSSLWTSRSTVLFILYECLIIWNAPHITSTWIDHENVLRTAKIWLHPKAPLLFTHWWLPSVILCIMCKSIEGHWCPWKAWVPSAICIPAFVILWCLHQYSGDRRTWKMLWVLLHLMVEKERALPWTVFLGTQ